VYISDKYRKNNILLLLIEYTYSLFVVFLIVFEAYSSITINDTYWSFLIAENANLYVGIQTSEFPNEAFLNVVLYGRKDAPFHFTDFLSSYGSVTYNYSRGNLVIGKDAKLGGIVYDKFSVIIPIPEGEISLVPISLLSKYFPNNYTILEVKPLGHKIYDGIENATFGNNSLCQNCFMTLFCIRPPFKFDKDYFLMKGVKIGLTQIYLIGYIDFYDITTQRGQMKVNVYQNTATGYFLTNSSYDNYIQISNDSNKISLSGSIVIEYRNQIDFYNFSSRTQIK